MRRKKPYQIHYRPQRQPRDVPGATPEDLALNAQGYLSVSQKALIADDMEAPRLFTMIFWGLAVVLLGIATVYGTNSYLPSAVFAACGLPFARRWTVARRAIRNNQVVCLEGPLYTETYTLMDSKRGGQWQELNVHHIRIGKEGFTLPRQVQSILEFGAIYRLYYTPTGRYLVAAELISIPEKSKRFLSKAEGLPEQKTHLF